MMNKIYTVLFFFFIISCSNIELVLKDEKQTNQIKGKVSLIILGDEEGVFTKGLYSFFNNNKNYEYILKTTIIEKKENRIVKNNQVAEKIDYTLEVKYELFYKTNECNIVNKKITSNFSFTPKSAGYNFGADRSFNKLYINSVNENIKKFINLGPYDTTCLQ